MEPEDFNKTFKSLSTCRRVLRDPEVKELPMEFRIALASLIDSFEGLMVAIAKLSAGKK